MIEIQVNQSQKGIFVRLATNDQLTNWVLDILSVRGGSEGQTSKTGGAYSSNNAASLTAPVTNVSVHGQFGQNENDS